MDYGALNSMTISSTTGTSRKEVGLIRDHAQTLFSFLQQLHVSKGSVREESVMCRAARNITPTLNLPAAW